jgi:Tol biopolymer transport system component
MKTILIRMLAVALAGQMLVAAQQAGDAERLLRAAMNTAMVDGNLAAAIKQYKAIVARYEKTNRQVAATALVRLADCYQKLGDTESKRIYERLLRDYADQKDAVTIARARLGGSETIVASKGDRAVWTGPSVDLFGQVSPDGRYITYVDWPGEGNLSVHDLVTNTDRVLTAAPTVRWSQFAEFSVISKDGTRVAYSWFNEKGRYDLRILPLHGTARSEPRKIIDSTDEIRSFAPLDWSSDSKWIAANIQRADGTGQIGLIGVADGTLRILKSVDWRGARRIAFSPDDRYIAYDLAVGDSDAERHVFVMAIDGSAESAVVADRSSNVVMAWTPDGRDVLFASDRTGQAALWKQGIAGGKPQGRAALVRRDVGSAYSLGMTKSGTIFVYKPASANFVQVAALDLDAAKIQPLSAKGFQRFVGSGGAPSWSADGQRLVYKSCSPAPSQACAINIASVDRNDVRQLWPKLSYLGGLRLLSNGTSFFAIGRDVKGRNGAFRVDAQNGELTPITIPRVGAIEVLSSDEKTLYFRRGASSGGALLARDLATGTERELFRRTDMSSMSMTISPDERYIASVAGAGLYLIPVGGGTVREVLHAKPREAFDGYRAAWTPDGQSLLLPKRIDNQALELWIVPMFDRREPRKMDVDTEAWALAGGGFAIHPSGRLIAFTGVAGKQGAEVWALENLLSAGAATKQTTR